MFRLLRREDKRVDGDGVGAGTGVRVGVAVGMLVSASVHSLRGRGSRSSCFQSPRGFLAVKLDALVSLFPFHRTGRAGCQAFDGLYQLSCISALVDFISENRRYFDTEKFRFVLVSSISTPLISDTEDVRHDSICSYMNDQQARCIGLRTLLVEESRDLSNVHLIIAPFACVKSLNSTVNGVGVGVGLGVDVDVGVGVGRGVGVGLGVGVGGLGSLWVVTSVANKELSPRGLRANRSMLVLGFGIQFSHIERYGFSTKGCAVCGGVVYVLPPRQLVAVNRASYRPGIDPMRLPFDRYL